jgi:hypothetical protein
MNEMNQNTTILRLLDFTKTDHPFGNVQGKEVYGKLKSYIDDLPSISIFGISLEGISATDASFPRESVISIAKSYRETKCFYLVNVENNDLLDNWDYAAQAKEQPIMVWFGTDFRILGPSLTSSTKELLEYVLKNSPVLASKVSTKFDISIQNASTRLKKLVSEGYIIRTEVIAESGGIEYEYRSIK